LACHFLSRAIIFPQIRVHPGRSAVKEQTKKLQKDETSLYDLSPVNKGQSHLFQLCAVRGGTMPTDPERERQRLMDVYSRMVDGEIEAIAEDEASLTAVALQVLHEEIARRGLDHLLSDQDKTQVEAADATEPEPMVTIRSFGDVMQAWLAKSNLESSAIECNLVDDNMVRLHWGMVNVLGGVKLQVKREDAEVALELLEQPVLEQPDEDEP
jgi:hypothetical protein